MKQLNLENGEEQLILTALGMYKEYWLLKYNEYDEMIERGELETEDGASTLTKRKDAEKLIYLTDHSLKLVDNAPEVDDLEVYGVYNPINRDLDY